MSFSTSGMTPPATCSLYSRKSRWTVRNRPSQNSVVNLSSSRKSRFWSSEGRVPLYFRSRTTTLAIVNPANWCISR